MSSRNHVPKSLPRPEAVYVALQGIHSEEEIAWALDQFFPPKHSMTAKEIAAEVTRRITEQHKLLTAELVEKARETARNMPAFSAAEWRQQAAIVRADTERRELSRERRLQREAQEALCLMRERLQRDAIPTRLHVCKLMQKVGVFA